MIGMRWILLVKDHKRPDGTILTAPNVLETRIRYGFWGISSKNRLCKRINQGDVGVFFVSSREGRYFPGECTIKSPPRKMDEYHRSLIEGYPSTMFDSYFEIEGRLWNRKVEITEVVKELTFITNKEKWWSYFQGGIRPLGDQDYRTIIRRVDVPAPS